MKKNPGDERSTQEIAQEANMTERTLARRCRQELGMCLTEWRNRLKVIKAIALIEEGFSVENIALEFGYANASSFIAMFKRTSGKTPAQYSPKMGYALKKNLS